MKLSQNAINDFKRIFLDKYGLKITDEKANELGIELLQFMKLIYRPIPKTYYAK